MVRLGGKAWTWALYAPNTIASVLFCIVSLITFADLVQVQWEESAGSLGTQLNGVLAATFMAPVLTGSLTLFSFFLLIKKSFSRSGTEFSYGVCTGFFLKNSMFLLLTGVSLSATKHFTHTFEASPTGVWAPSATNAYVGTEVLAFICCGFHLAMAATLINNRKAFGHAQLTVDELGLSTRLRSSGTPSSSAPAAGAPATAGAGQSGAWSTV
ncbi:hypothetical protein D9Q98_001147 [Chlorella vulgaris]|uniref:Uncharacterized protein n=1 Tax=Chlorella vulgaris TaxID=3077 RepID=A0A9D4Z2R4_CHLVU|nr:hypothetical protein D9Q98_001147 [Chlorella vulgaris]